MNKKKIYLALRWFFWPLVWLFTLKERNLYMAGKGKGKNYHDIKMGLFSDTFVGTYGKQERNYPTFKEVVYRKSSGVEDESGKEMLITFLHTTAGFAIYTGIGFLIYNLFFKA